MELSKKTTVALKALYRAIHADTHGLTDFDDCIVCDKLDDVMQAQIRLIEIMHDGGA